MPSVRLVNISKRYGAISATKSVSLEIQNKEYVCIIGPSGCGKTTLIKSIEGIIEPTEGDIYIDSELISRKPIQDRGVGYVFQEIALFPHMNVYANVSYGPMAKGWKTTKAKSLSEEMLNLMALRDRAKDYPATLSGGAQQKTAIARALSSGSGLLLFDEPLGSLDAKVRTVLRHELRRMVKDLGLTAIHVTHDQEEAMAIADRVVVMRSGKIVEVGKPLDLYLHPKTLFTANFVGEANFVIGEILTVTEDGARIRVGENTLYSAEKPDLESSKVVVAIRPEFIIMKKTGTGWTAKIKNKIPVGSTVRYEVRTDNDELFVVKCPINTGSENWNIGDNTILMFPPDSVLLYSYPEKGLEKEISVE